MKLQATIYIPEEENDFHIDIYQDKNDSHQIAEIFKRDGQLIIQLCNNPNNSITELNLVEFIKVLTKSYDELKN